MTRASKPSSTVEACDSCSGAGWLIDPTIGQLVRCAVCADLRAECGLTEAELRTTPESIKGGGEAQETLRFLARYCIENPRGWLTLWGDYGTAKSLTAQAIVAGLASRGVSARYVHAGKVEQLWFDDLHGDACNAQLLERVPVLAVDELDKINLRSEWIRKKVQALADARYRTALAGKSFTVWIVQANPASILPGDIASRMEDGRFFRPWFLSPNSLTVERWGSVNLPGCLHIQGEDARPYIKPLFLD
jgi:hypothetical protein